MNSKQLQQSIEDVIEYTIQENEPEEIRALAQQEQEKYAHFSQEQKNVSRTKQDSLNTLIRRSNMFMNAYNAAYAKTQNDQKQYEYYVNQALQNT